MTDGNTMSNHPDPYTRPSVDPWGAALLGLGVLFFVAGFFWGFHDRAVVGLLFILLLFVNHVAEEVA